MLDPGSDATVQTWWMNHSRCGGGVRVRRNLRAADALEVPQMLPDVLHIPESKSCFVLGEVARVHFNSGPPHPPHPLSERSGPVSQAGRASSLRPAAYFDGS